MDSPSTVFFIGHETFLQKLHTAFVDHPMVVIVGRSGIGKTAVLREYSQRFSQHYQSIIWLNAATDETFLADLIAALQLYSLPTAIDLGTAQLFQNLHNYMRTQQHTLLILDNFAYNFAVQELSEQPPHMRTVIITQAQQTPPEIPRLELTGLDANDGAVLLLQQAGLLFPQEIEGEEQQAALELAHALHGLPAALDLAGRYLHVTGSSVQDALSALRDYPAALHPPTDSDKSAIEEFSIVCERSLTYVKEINPAAFELLQMYALFLPEAIPGALLQSPTEQTLPENGTEQEQEIRQLLLAAGLVHVDPQAALFSMHRLLQYSIRQSLTSEQQQQRIEQILRLLQSQLALLQTETLPTRLRIAGQIRHLATISESESAFSDTLRSVNEAADVFSWAATLFWELQLANLAEPLLRRALSIWKHTLGTSHPMVASVLSNLAVMNTMLKQYTEAEAFAHQTITSKTSALGIDHPDVLLALDQLGHIYAEQGKQKEAKQCYEKALTIGKKVNLTHHPHYNTARYDLALLFMEQKNWSRAKDLLMRVSIGRTTTLGREDPGTLEAFFRLAEVCMRQKNWPLAQLAYRRALPGSEKTLGGEHPTILRHLEQEANVFLHLGKIAEAKQLLQRVREVKERTLGEEHGDLIPCLNGLARVALAEEEYSTGLVLLERAQQLYARQAEPDPLTLAALLDTVATIELAQQHFAQATATYKRALELSVQVLGEKQPELIDPLEHLATAYSAQKEDHRAEQYLLQAISIYQEEQRPEDMVLDPVLNRLADIQIERQHFEVARMYLDRSRAIRELALGKNDPLTVEIVQKLANVTNIHGQ